MGFRGQKRARRGRAGVPRKKPKRSKNFWKHRPTVERAPVPESSDSESDLTEEEEEELGGYSKLLDVFGGAQYAGGNSPRSSASDSDLQDGDGDQASSEDEGEKGDAVSLGEGTTSSEEENGIEEEKESVHGIEDRTELSDQDGHDEVEKEDALSSDDPFTAHFEPDMPPALRETAEKGEFTRTKSRLKSLGRLMLQIPRWDNQDDEKGPKKVTLDKDADAESVQSSTSKWQMEYCKSVDFSHSNNLDHLKERLKRSVLQVRPSGLSRFEQDIFSLMNSYRDVCYCDRTHANGEELRLVYTLHAANHILKTRARILLNNARLAKKSDAEKLSLECRDQGFCRPKVLIVVPFRNSAKKIVNCLASLLFEDPKGKVANKIRFDEEFDAEDAVRKNKPEDFYETFQGNTDDGFRIGMALSKKSLKLYTDFYSSDIIIASPLGLRMVIGSVGDKDQDFDFLASIEVLIMDQVDVFAMQNWEHVTHLLSHLHLPLARTHGADFSRVRMWSLDYLSHHYRQTLLFSRVSMPEMNAIFNKSCRNYMGKVLVEAKISTGLISQVLVSIPMVFHRFECKSVMSSPSDRLDYFTNRIMPDYKKDMMFHTLVFVPSYLDYVKVRNWFTKSDLDYLEVCEYTKDSKIAKARDHFFHGEAHFMLYTERSHFFRRFTLKGIRHLIFYQLPQYPHFFSDLCNMMHAVYQNRKGGSDGNMSIKVLYSEYDRLRLNGVVGNKRCEQIMASKKKAHMFVAGSHQLNG